VSRTDADSWDVASSVGAQVRASGNVVECLTGHGKEFPDTDELAPLRNSLAVIATRN
jgi:hypothetical protein